MAVKVMLVKEKRLIRLKKKSSDADKMIITTPKARVKRVFFDNVSGSVHHSIADVLRRLEINPETIDMFIRLGYVTGNETLFKGIQCLPGGATIQISNGRWKVVEQFRYGDLVDNEKYRDMSEKALIKRGKRIWLQVIDGLYNDRSEIVVPISGGLDSRAILAGLIECAEASNIQTYTFGLPNTFDFEIGKRVAVKAGTRHTIFDLSRFNLKDEMLAKTCRYTDGNTNIFTSMFLLPITESYSRTADYWSGFMGDPLAGSHIPRNININLKKAIRDYYLREAKRISSHSIPSNQLDDWMRVVNLDSCCSKKISFDEQIDFFLRQERNIANQLFPGNYSFVTPFLESEWIEFILSAPFSYRIGTHIYKCLLQQSFPSLFSIPTSGNFGLPLTVNALRVKFQRIKHRVFSCFLSVYKNPSLNYIDFSRQLRMNSQLKRVVKDSLEDLRKRKFVDVELIDRLWNAHQTGKQDNAFLLMNYASLEKIIKTFNIKC